MTTGMGMRQDQYDTFVYDSYDEDVLNTISKRNF